MRFYDSTKGQQNKKFKETYSANMIDQCMVGDIVFVLVICVVSLNLHYALFYSSFF